MDLGSRLRTARLAAKMTQEEVARTLFVTRQTVSRWEQGKNLPNIYALKDLSQLYQVEVQYFFDQPEAEAPKKSLHIWSLLGVILFNALFFLYAFFTMWVIWLVLWVLALVFLLTPLLYFTQIDFVHIYINDQQVDLNLWNSLLFCAIGLLLVPVMVLLTRQIWRFTKNYIRYNIKSVYR